MFHNRVRSSFLFLGSFLLCFGFLLSKGWMDDLEAVNGNIGVNKLGVHIENASVGDIEKLEEEIRPIPMEYTYSIKKQKVIQNEYNSLDIDVMAVSKGYSNFTHIKMKKGNFFKEPSKYDPVIVLDEDTAYALFHSLDVVGLPVWIDEQAYRIIGIREKNTSSLFPWWLQEEKVAYVPVESSIVPADEITDWHMQIAITMENKEGIKKRIEQATKQIGEGISSEMFMDYQGISQRNQGKVHLFTGILGVIAGILIGNAVYGKLKSFLKHCRDEVDLYHLKSISSIKRKELLLEMGELICYTTFLFILLIGMDIQPERWMKEIRGWNIWTESWKSIFYMGTGEINDVFWVLTLMMNVVLPSSLLMGSIFLLVGIKRAFFSISAFTVLSIILSSGLLAILNISIDFHWQEGFVIWAYIMGVTYFSFCPILSCQKCRYLCYNRITLTKYRHEGWEQDESIESIDRTDCYNKCHRFRGLGID